MSTPAASVSKLGYVEFTTPDPDRLVDYYETCLGFHVEERSPDLAYLSTGLDHHSVIIRKGERNARTSIGYQLAGAVDDAQRRLVDAGFDVSRRSDIAPSTPEVLVMTEPSTGTPLHLYADHAAGAAGDGPVQRPTKLGHVAAFTPSLGQLQGFYEDLLGFRWSDTVGDFFVFLRCNADHHAANFLQSTSHSGMHHVAYEMRDLNHLQAALDHLAVNGYRLFWGPGRHGPGHNIFSYHRDPDGNTVELFTQLDSMVDEAHGYWEPRPWHATRPEVPRTWEVDVLAVNSWGPVLPEALEH